MKFEGIINKDESEEISAFALKRETHLNDEDILANFDNEQQKLIKERQKQLSALAYYIGKDFKIPVILGVPTKDCPSGWMWAKRKDGSRFIQMNVFDLATKPMDFLRFVTSHEGGHARISRLDFVPPEVWRQKGFGFLMNVIEDPRDNNFVASNYPNFAEQMKLAYEVDEEQAKEAKEKAKASFGFQPRFNQAGFEYIKQWYRWYKKEPYAISSDLPEEVRQVVEKTLASGEDAWRRYPTKEEADAGEENIQKYAKVVYDIILEEIWPEFQKLVEQDVEDAKAQEFLKDLEGKKKESTAPSPSSSEEGKGEEGEQEKDGDFSSGDILPPDLKGKLTPEEQKELEGAIEKAIEEAKKEMEKEKLASAEDSPSEAKEGKAKDEQKSDDSGETGSDGLTEEPLDIDDPKGSDETGETNGSGKLKPIDLDSLSPELKKKIKDFIDSLPEDKKKELTDQAEKSLKEFEKEINKEIEGKLVENPEERENRERKEEEERKTEEDLEKERKTGEKDEEAEKQKQEEAKKEQLVKESKEMLDRVRKNLEGSENEYQREMIRLAPQINSLKEKLAVIFQERRKRGIRSGFEEGEEIDVERRMQEKAKGISIFESKAWRRTELPREKDYAISLLVDLSGSMQGEKIDEAFEATILFTEVLNSLGIKIEILGFNARLYEYQKFSERLSGEIRKKIITMKNQVDLPGAEDNDDGWAVTETAKRLSERKEKEKLLIVISDGEPDNSEAHNKPEYELGTVIEKIMKEGEVKLVGLGLGSSGISAVKRFYPKHLLANSAEEMIDKIGELLLEVIKG